MTPDDIVKRLRGYLFSGGLFNPELANHDAVRDLIRDAADLIERQASALEKAEKALNSLLETDVFPTEQRGVYMAVVRHNALTSARKVLATIRAARGEKTAMTDAASHGDGRVN